MESLLWLIPALPLLGFLVLSLFWAKLSRRLIAWIGAGSVCLSALLALWIGISFLSSPPAGGRYVQVLWTWFQVAEFKPQVAFSLDALTLVFVFVITFIGALIHIYSVEYMAADRDYARFFACMNLFVTSMLILVLADNLLLMYLGWEGVGLCSYLLIGFWYEKPENGYAARKAFLITRIGDTAMAIALFILFYHFETLNIREILSRAPHLWASGTRAATIVALLLLAGGIGKSAQLPLQTWLPDAMAGPSPVSALIHAATMVTAGVYLVARMHTVFELSPLAMAVVAIIGTVTLFMAACSALTQYDLKRVLAYSTMSQIGYMFLALGVGAWSAGIFHFMVHAFFKALLFLAAGAVIEALHHEQNMFNMGGLKDRLPLVFWTFLIGSASLLALPLISAGFYSKDQIMWYAWAAEGGNPWLWFIAFAGAFLTAVYTTRMMVITFWGEVKTPVSHHPGALIKVPLVILAIFSCVAGFIYLPENFAHFAPFESFLGRVLPQVRLGTHSGNEAIFQLLAALATFGGIWVGYSVYFRKHEAVQKFRVSNFWNSFYRLWLSGWRFDRIYDSLFVRPFVTAARAGRRDVLDKIYSGISSLNVRFYRLLSASQSGSLRWYLMGFVVGSIIILGLQIVL